MRGPRSVWLEASLQYTVQMSCTRWRLLHNILCCTLTAVFCTGLALYCNALRIKCIANVLHSLEAPTQYILRCCSITAVFRTGFVPIALYCNALHICTLQGMSIWRLLHNILRCCTVYTYFIAPLFFCSVCTHCAYCTHCTSNFLHSQCLAQDCTAVLLSKTFQPVVQTIFSNGYCPIQAMCLLNVCSMLFK